MRGMRKISAIALVAVGLGLLPTAAQATPASRVTGTVLARGTMTDHFRLRADGATEFVVRQITIQPGGDTGWHYHPGTVLAVVQRGTLTHTDANCRSVSYRAGQSLVEPSGSKHVHIGRNLGPEPVELYVTYVDPIGSPRPSTRPAPDAATKDITSVPGDNVGWPRTGRPGMSGPVRNPPGSTGSLTQVGGLDQLDHVVGDGDLALREQSRRGAVDDRAICDGVFAPVAGAVDGSRCHLVHRAAAKAGTPLYSAK